MTLRSRLALGLATIALILVVPLIVALRSLDGVQGGLRELRAKEFAASLLLGQLRDSLSGLRRAEDALLFVKTQEQHDRVTNSVANVARMANRLAGFGLDSAARRIDSAIRAVADWAPREFEAVLANPTVADSISETYVRPALERANQGVAEAEVELRTRTTQRVEAASEAVENTRDIALIILIVAALVAAAYAFFLTRSISRPVIELEQGMAAVADGDLSYRLKIRRDRDDEFGRLAHSFQEMNRQLKELDKLKAEFVSVASHELKTPINVIIGYLQLLDEGIYGDLTPKQHEIHKTLGVQANLLLRLVKQLLDVSRFEAGGGRLELRKTSLEKLLHDLESAFHVLAVQREVSFHVERRPGLPESVQWDADRVNEVLGNLLSNAFKFTPRGGRVDLIVEPVEASIAMEVRDTGAGIPPDQLPRIFEKFYQADNQKSASAAGSGLGLAIAKQIVEAHGGRIACDSTPGVGTSFSIALPIIAQRRTSAQLHLHAIGK
jgi:signal transduction histidine kinase